MKEIERKKAITLRGNGMSIPKIANELKVSTSTVAIWVKNVILTEEQYLSLKNNKNRNIKIATEARIKNRREKRIQYQEIGKININRDCWEHAAGCMLFWAEGTKNKNHLQFTNTDINMLKFFVKFLKKYYNILNEQITLTFQYHDQDVNEIFDFLIKTLDIEGCKKTKPYCKLNHVSIKNTKHKYGVVRITLHNTELVNKIWGAVQAYLEFNEPNLLK